MAFEYVVKFVIGASPVRPEVLAPGYYWTAINILNPSRCADAHLRWKAAQALPALQQGVSSPWSTATLDNGRGFEIDNADIDAALIAGGADRKPWENDPNGRIQHGKGFVVIRSDVELDVVAVYTAAGADRGVAFHTERVPARHISDSACGILAVNFDTNTSWTVRPPNSSVFQAASAYRYTDWAQAVNGAEWIGFASGANNATYVYRKTFEIGCDDVYRITSGSLSIRSDAGATVRLNGVLLGTVPGNYPTSFPVGVVALQASALRVGQNVLEIEVFNTNGATGLFVDGTVRIAGAQCLAETAELPERTEPKR